MRQVLRIAREGGCRSVVVEERYIDPDYRSEYSAFWSRRFEERRPLAKRLHFFAAPIEPETLHVAPPAGSYLGYTVLRPTDLGPVGRTVLRPPPRLGDAVLTTVRDRPSLFGNPLDVLGVPFCQQDGEFLVCAHSAAWLCHYVAHHRGVIGRRMTAEIASIPSVEGSKHRPLPATGLTGEQMQAIFSSLGIPALFYDATDLPRLPTEFPAGGFRIRGQRHRQRQRQRQRQREQLLRVVCKYINSGFPVVVLTGGRQAHAFTLVGWREEAGAIQLIACDDQVGPYEVIEDPLASVESHRVHWRYLMVPLPEKVFFTGESAEVRARNIPPLTLELTQDAGLTPTPELERLVSSLEALSGPISIRARLMEGRHFKAAVAGQGRSAEVVRLIRMAHLPHWIWLVEMQDRVARRQGQPCVIAEWVFDSTAHDDVPRERLASLLDGTTDAGEVGSGSAELYRALGTGRPWRSLITDPELMPAGSTDIGPPGRVRAASPRGSPEASSSPLIGSRPDSWLPNRLPTARWSNDGGASWNAKRPVLPDVSPVPPPEIEPENLRIKSCSPGGVLGLGKPSWAGFARFRFG